MPKINKPKIELYIIFAIVLCLFILIVGAFINSWLIAALGPAVIGLLAGIYLATTLPVDNDGTKRSKKK